MAKFVICDEFENVYSEDYRCAGVTKRAVTVHRCSDCGQKVDLDDKFCRKCGSPLKGYVLESDKAKIKRRGLTK